MHITTIFINFILTQDTQYAKVKNNFKERSNKVCFLGENLLYIKYKSL